MNRVLSSMISMLPDSLFVYEETDFCTKSPHTLMSWVPHDALY